MDAIKIWCYTARTSQEVERKNSERSSILAIDETAVALTFTAQRNFFATIKRSC